MLNTYTLKWGIWLLLGVLWSNVAWASSITLASDLATIPLAALGISSLLSLIGGAGRSAQKMADPATIVASVPLEVFKDLLLSMIAGLLMFFMANIWHWDALLQAFTITLAGYTGSRSLEAVGDKFIDFIKSWSKGATS